MALWVKCLLPNLMTPVQFLVPTRGKERTDYLVLSSDLYIHILTRTPTRSLPTQNGHNKNFKKISNLSLGEDKRCSRPSP